MPTMSFIPTGIAFSHEISETGMGGDNTSGYDDTEPAKSKRHRRGHRRGHGPQKSSGSGLSSSSGGGGLKHKKTRRNSPLQGDPDAGYTGHDGHGGDYGGSGQQGASVSGRHQETPPRQLMDATEGTDEALLNEMQRMSVSPPSTQRRRLQHGRAQSSSPEVITDMPEQQQQQQLLWRRNDAGSVVPDTLPSRIPYRQGSRGYGFNQMMTMTGGGGGPSAIIGETAAQPRPPSPGRTLGGGGGGGSGGRMRIPKVAPCESDFIRVHVSENGELYGQYKKYKPLYDSIITGSGKTYRELTRNRKVTKCVALVDGNYITVDNQRNLHAEVIVAGLIGTMSSPSVTAMIVSNNVCPEYKPLFFGHSIELDQERSGGLHRLLTDKKNPWTRGRVVSESQVKHIAPFWSFENPAVLFILSSQKNNDPWECRH